MTVFQQTFSAGEVVSAADMTMASLQNWMKRRFVVGHQNAPIEGGGSPGRHRRFSWFNVMEVAVAQALTQAGLTDLPLAFNAARGFAHAGHGALPNRPERHPAMPFPPEHGRTFLAVAGEHSDVFLWQPGKDPMAYIRHGLGKPEGFVLLDTLSVFDRACRALNLHPSRVLDEAYDGSE